MDGSPLGDAHRSLPASVRRAFLHAHGRPPALLVRAPGRVNLLGAHVDYNEGCVLPCAIDRAVVLAAAPRDDRRWHVAALDLDEREQLDLAALPSPVPARPTPDVRWSDYVAAVAHALLTAGLPPLGLDLAFASDVPIGAGLSSSAAVEMALVLAWHELALATGRLARPLGGVERVLLGRSAENAYLGVGSGIMDPFACVHGADDQIVLLDCRTLEHELLPLPADTSVLVIDSGLRRRLVDSGFNDRRRECERAVELLRARLPGIATLRDVTPDELALHEDVLPPTERRRAHHVVEECARVQAGADALRAGDMAAFGELVRQSHVSVRDLYEVSVPELDTLAEAAWSVPGCHGARLTGAGFGGCVVALADRSAVAAVRAHVDETYARAHGRRAVVHTCRAVRGAHVLAD